MSHGITFRGLAVLAVMAVAALLAPSVSASFQNVNEGAAVPGFKLQGLDGKEGSLDAYKADNAVVLLFFATWSERAMAELSDLGKMSKELGGKGLKVVAINVEHEHTDAAQLKEIKDKVDALGLPFPVLLDAGLETYRAYGVVAVPSTAVLGRGAVLKETLNGYPSFAAGELRDRIEGMLGLRAVEVPAAKAAEPAYKPNRQALLNYNLGRRLFEQGLYDKAEAKLKAAAEADPKWAPPQMLLGQSLLVLSRKDKAKLQDARKAFEAAVLAEPENVVAHTGLGRVYWKLANAADAEREAGIALKKNGSYPPALLLQASILAAKGDAAGSEKAMAEAIALNPRDPSILAMAGTVYEGAGQLAKAADMYRKAWQLGGE